MKLVLVHKTGSLYDLPITDLHHYENILTSAAPDAVTILVQTPIDI